MTQKLSDRRPIIRLALSRAEVALAIGVSVASVDQMVAEGALPLPRNWHSRKLWLVCEIEAYLNELPIDGEERGGELYEKWKDGAFETSQRQPVKGVGGYDIIVDHNHPLKRHYDKLGFDPATMGQEDMNRLMTAADERWKASIPGTPLGKREHAVLDQLAPHGIGVAVDSRKVKCGPETEDRLKARGFIETRSQKKFPVGSYVLTEAGFRAWEKIP